MYRDRYGRMCNGFYDASCKCAGNADPTHWYRWSSWDSPAPNIAYRDRKACHRHCRAQSSRGNDDTSNRANPMCLVQFVAVIVIVDPRTSDDSTFMQITNKAVLARYRNIVRAAVKAAGAATYNHRRNPRIGRRPRHEEA